MTRNAYGGEGRVTARTDGKGARSMTQYDQAGRVIQTITPKGAATRFAFCRPSALPALGEAAPEPLSRAASLIH